MALVQTALAELAHDDRAVFIAVDLDGGAVPAVAEALDIPLNTAYSRLRRARVTISAVSYTHLTLPTSDLL